MKDVGARRVLAAVLAFAAAFVAGVTEVWYVTAVDRPTAFTITLLGSLVLTSTWAGLAPSAATRRALLAILATVCMYLGFFLGTSLFVVFWAIGALAGGALLSDPGNLDAAGTGSQNRR